MKTDVMYLFKTTGGSADFPRKSWTLSHYITRKKRFAETIKLINSTFAGYTLNEKLR